ncbi:uncharacterized protein F4807DRAFT_422760 [Annulohypoxylon truncatum]|uniref:uncharacterized protein n=1 Tax=Annulohypoxylon truncatum TaxID=327061 RepID=UPI002007E6CC|nr:uncharacterized protein F4807DRAFT_422760 [Annulohypoxylon truncatum]KAI1210283.1 hypothetical protein F4807DRAFT_422760 [Annulohypoxylon truncatum]
MADNNVAERAEAGATHQANTANAANASNVPDDLKEAGRSSTVPPIISDIFQPRINSGPKTLLSHPSSQSQQSPTTEPKVQGSTTTIALSPSQHTKLAVHIRSTSSPSPSQPRRGRPPKDKSREVRSGLASITPGKITSGSLPSAENEIGGTSPQPKKRGRPRGWKPGMAYVDVKGGGGESAKPTEPKKTQSKEAKRRGRPPRTLLPSAREQYLRANAQYLPFLCEWRYSPSRTCPAELQNMKALRKHIDLVHGEEEPLACRWGRCGARKNPIEFPANPWFDEHMEKAHFRSLVWHMGEGYQNDGISALKRNSDGLPKYLFDKDGKQVTPSVKEQQFEDDHQYKERKRKLKQLLIQQEENAPFEEEYTKQTLGIS